MKKILSLLVGSLLIACMAGSAAAMGINPNPISVNPGNDGNIQGTAIIKPTLEDGHQYTLDISCNGEFSGKIRCDGNTYQSGSTITYHQNQDMNLIVTTTCAPDGMKRDGTVSVKFGNGGVIKDSGSCPTECPS